MTDELVGKRVKILHNRGGASQYGEIIQIETPDQVRVVPEGEGTWIYCGLSGLEVVA